MFANDRKWSLLMRYSWSVYDDVGFVYSHGRGAQQPLCSACVSSIRVTILLYHLFSRCSNVTALQSIWFHLPLCAYHKPQYVTSCHQLNLQLTDHINVTHIEKLMSRMVGSSSQHSHIQTVIYRLTGRRGGTTDANFIKTIEIKKNRHKLSTENWWKVNSL